MEITALKIVVGAAGVADSAVTGSNLGEARGAEPATNSGGATHGTATDNWTSQGGVPGTPGQAP